jgi:hypothetical protein
VSTSEPRIIITFHDGKQWPEGKGPTAYVDLRRNFSHREADAARNADRAVQALLHGAFDIEVHTTTTTTTEHVEKYQLEVPTDVRRSWRKRSEGQ